MPLKREERADFTIVITSTWKKVRQFVKIRQRNDILGLVTNKLDFFQELYMLNIEYETLVANKFLSIV